MLVDPVATKHDKEREERGDDGNQSAAVRADRAADVRGVGAARPFLPAAGAGTRPRLRAGAGGAVLRRGWTAERRSGGLLQAPIGDVLRRHSQRAAAAAAGS